MPENLSDFPHRCPGAQHGSRQAVTKQVRSLERWV